MRYWFLVIVDGREAAVTDIEASNLDEAREEADRASMMGKEIWIYLSPELEKSLKELLCGAIPENTEDEADGSDGN